MRPIIDVEELADHPSGLGIFVARLLRALRQDGVDVRMFFPGWEKAGGDRVARAAAQAVPGLPLSRWRLPRRWVPMAAGWLRRRWGEGAVVHAPGNHVRPWGLAVGLPVVVTLHDLFWLDGDAADGAPPAYRRLVLSTLPAALRRPSTVVTAVSEFTRAAIINRLGVPPDRVFVTPCGLQWEGDPPPSEAAATEARRRLGLADDGYIIAVGSLSRRKNYPTLLAAFDRLREAEPAARLVVVGRANDDPWDGGAALRRALADRGAAVVHRPTLPADDLRALYAGARFFAAPSFGEGFGLPLLEAMASGTPAVYAAGSAMDEVAGGAGAALAAGDADGWARTFVRLWRDPAERAARRAAGLERARRFTWAHSAAVAVEAYARALSLRRNGKP